MKKTMYLCLFALIAFTLFASKVYAQITITYNHVYHNCDSEMYYVSVSDTAGTLTLQTRFGDGTVATHSFTDSFGYIHFGHIYAAPGLYSVKHILLNSGVPIDSVLALDSVTCNYISLTAYLDNNGNCVYDGGDDMVSFPYTVEVDSSGYPIDTFTATSLYYFAYGPPGTIYTFRVITPPSGLVATCPTSGIIYDTIGTSSWICSIGFQCGTTTTDFDLAEYVNVGGPGRHESIVNIDVTNAFCTPHDATLTMTFSPKYNFTSATPTPATVVGNVITWYFPTVSEVGNQHINALFQVPGAWLIPGDTIQSRYVVTPISGDLDSTNNTEVRVDTVKLSYDPNDKSVTPAGIIAAGTNLDYKIVFENTGNAPAVNIHVQDTLSNDLDIKSFKLQSATAPVYTYITNDGMGHNVIKFDFPNINLLDSSHHGLCDGMVTFTINAKAGLSAGTVITNHAGIYFDENAVVMTDTTWNQIGVATSVANMSNIPSMQVYPNPVNDVLTIETAIGSYNSMTITNTMGQTELNQQINAVQTNVNVKSLPSGIYYIMLKGDNGVKVQKFEKL